MQVHLLHPDSNFDAQRSLCGIPGDLLDPVGKYAYVQIPHLRKHGRLCLDCLSEWLTGRIEEPAYWPLEEYAGQAASALPSTGKKKTDKKRAPSKRVRKHKLSGGTAAPPEAVQ